MKRIQWTAEQEAILRARYPHEKTERLVEALGHSISSIYQRAANLGLRKTPEFLASPHARRLDGKIGAAGRFKKGHQAWNAGMKGLQIGGVSTQFKPGHRGGKAVELYQPIGAERISKDGYLQRKINDDMPLQKRWRGVHILVWEAATGPLPEGHAVSFRDGNKQNTALDNLELVTRAELMTRNSIHNLPEELKDVIRLNGVIRRKINGTRHQ